MNIHKNARLTYVRRIEMVQDITLRGQTVAQAATAHRVSDMTARKWLGRYLAHGEAALFDKSSRPEKSPSAIEPSKALAIVELRRKFMLQASIASSLAVSKATVSRVLRRAGLSKLSDLRPPEPVVRYEHEAPGDLLHIDTKKLGRIERPSHRVTGNRADTFGGAGWEVLFVAVDDHARIGFTQMHPDERKSSAVAFLQASVSYYAGLGIQVRALLTDNGSPFRSKDFKQACAELNIKHRFTRAYRPQTNGKAERFIQSALREWAYGQTYQHSRDRTNALARWIHHYKWHRPHHGIGCRPPMSRLPDSGNNVLTLHN